MGLHCTHCYERDHTQQWCMYDHLPKYSQCADPATRKEREIAWRSNKFNYANKIKAKANAAYALTAQAQTISTIAQAADAAAVAFNAVTPNEESRPSITVDGGCNVSLAHTAAFNDVVVPGTTKFETTKFATAGNDIISTKHGQLQIDLKRNNGTSVTFIEPKLCASGPHTTCPSPLTARRARGRDGRSQPMSPPPPPPAPPPPNSAWMLKRMNIFAGLLKCVDLRATEGLVVLD